MTKPRVRIIAEVGVNHDGSLRKAMALVDAAVQAGADVVKFQSFRAEALASRGAAKAPYQRASSGETQLEMLRRLQLSESDQHELAQYCQRRAIGFLTTPFDLPSLEFVLDRLALPEIKVGSGDLTNGPLLLRIARAGRQVILSTGMSTSREIAEALAILAYGYLGETPERERSARSKYVAKHREHLQGRVILLHCTSEYPAPPASLNLLALRTLADDWGLPVGYSDHSRSRVAAIAAVTLGAVVLEKHLTLDRRASGPDHAASCEPNELAEWISEVRQLEQALGSGEKRPSDGEIVNARVARKSLVAKTSLRTGDIFSEENLTVKRPGMGISPMEYWEWLGKAADRAYEPDELICRSSSDTNQRI